MNLPKFDFAKTGTALQQTLFPDTCLTCARRVSTQGTLCPNCWARLHIIERPYCEITGSPFAHDFGQGFVSAEAIANPPPFRRARAAAIHNGVARQLVTNLKYNDRNELARWMAKWMVRAARELTASADLVVPVPLHRWRHWSRQYNQSAELARFFAAETELAFMPQVLRRIKNSKPQVGLTADQRRRNVSGVFKVPDEQNIHVNGRAIILIDDVFTTGATVEAATKALLKAKAASVDVVTFSRVVLDHLEEDRDYQIEPTLYSRLRKAYMNGSRG